MSSQSNQAPTGESWIGDRFGGAPPPDWSRLARGSTTVIEPGPEAYADPQLPPQVEIPVGAIVLREAATVEQMNQGGPEAAAPWAFEKP
jgi:hypothetical protein